SADAIDSFLTEPDIWQLEFGRVVTERAPPGLAADSTDVTNPERRAWSFREVATVITIYADEQRAEALRAVGDRLVERAQQLAVDHDPEYLATVRIWASALDRTTYRETTENGRTIIQSTPPADAIETLAAGNDELQRGSEVTALQFKYITIGNPRYAKGPPPDGPEVTADLKRINELLTNPPQQTVVPVPHLAVLVASNAIRALASGDLVLKDEWARFAVEIVLRFVEALGPPDRHRTDPPSSDMDPDRHAARALPAMLVPGATPFRDEAGADPHPRVLATGLRLAQSAALETRIELVQALGDVWTRPCAQEEKCWHRHALDWTIESMRDCVMGPFSMDLGRRASERLGDPVGDAVAGTADADIYVGRLDAALWGLTSAATSGSCVAGEAGELLIEALAANRRGTLAHKENYDAYGTHARAAARGLLALAADGDSTPLWHHLTEYFKRPDHLYRLVRGLALFAADQEKTATTARALWPEIMGRALGDGRRSFTDDLSGTSALAALLPRPGDPISWTDPIGWTEQVDAWIDAAAGRPRCIEAFIVFIGDLDVEQQARLGLPRIATLVGANVAAATGLSILDRWILDVRNAAHRAGDGESWQRLVDALVMAGNSRLSALSD
ncbi:MAG: hypothetical protein JWM93_1407, partial [Frankiales bacterium]|nr:hypothetical protein [Frankiales bacterium]